jgi:hypothetical protein
MPVLKLQLSRNAPSRQRRTLLVHLGVVIALLAPGLVLVAVSTGATQELGFTLLGGAAGAGLDTPSWSEFLRGSWTR